MNYAFLNSLIVKLQLPHSYANRYFPSNVNAKPCGVYVYNKLAAESRGGDGGCICRRLYSTVRLVGVCAGGLTQAMVLPLEAHHVILLLKAKHVCCFFLLNHSPLVRCSGAVAGLELILLR